MRLPGNRRLAEEEVGEVGLAPTRGPPTTPPGPPDGCGLRRDCVEGGAPCLDRENAFILAWKSEFRPLARPGSGPGLLAAFVGPRGAEEGLIADDIPLDCEPNDGTLALDSGGGLCDGCCDD